MYADWARALKQSITLTYRVASHLGNDPHPHPLSPEEAAPLMAEATVARDPSGEALLLLGSPEVVEKADRTPVRAARRTPVQEADRTPVTAVSGSRSCLPACPRPVPRRCSARRPVGCRRGR